MNSDQEFADAVTRAAMGTVGAVFASLGRVLLCLDHSFRVVHASSSLSDLVGEAAAGEVVGRPAQEVLGEELFGERGLMRDALERGERREGWRATLKAGDRPRAVSVTGVPFQRSPDFLCDPRVSYFVVIRAPGEGESVIDAAPAVFGGLISRSPRMHAIFRLIENLEHSETTVLIEGESGTGKEILARAIHAHSPRHAGPLVAVNCGALPRDLLESELFGHVRGAFTGAVRDRAGRFELAEGGTLFLDEVGDLPQALQVKLLRVLQERTFERVGESKPRTTDARIIAATNVDLRDAVEKGRFREDLFYRLRVVPIEVPPLRARREDIDPIAHHLLSRVSTRQKRSVRFSPNALRLMLDYAWPGNVREMENAIEYAVVVCQGQTIMPEDLPAEITSPPPHRKPAPTPTEAARRRAHEPGGDPEALRRELEKHQWRRADVARALGISRSTLWRRMREAGLSR